MRIAESLALLRFRRKRLSALVHRARVGIASQGVSTILRKLNRGEGAPRPAAVAASAEPGIPRVLVIDAVLPRPDRDSGSQRAVQLLKLIRECGHAVDFLAERGGQDGAHLAVLQDLGIRVLPSADPARDVLRAIRAGADYRAVIVCRYHLAEYWMPFVAAQLPRAKRILDTVDLHHLRESREATLHENPRLQALAASTRRRELAAIDASDEAWVVSPEELRVLQTLGCRRPIKLVPNLHEPAAQLPRFDDRGGVLFVGGAGHPPNVDAVRWLLQDILPGIHATRPDIHLHLVGAGLSEAMPDPLPPGVTCHDHVPDLAPLLGAVRIGIAPLRFGAGVKGKVSQCLALGLPVVVTPCAAEGMHLEHGVDALIAGDAQSFAAEIIRLHDDRLLWDTLSRNGRKVIAAHFSPSTLRPTIAASLANPPSA